MILWPVNKSEFRETSELLPLLKTMGPWLANQDPQKWTEPIKCHQRSFFALLSTVIATVESCYWSKVILTISLYGTCDFWKGSWRAIRARPRITDEARYIIQPARPFKIAGLFPSSKKLSPKIRSRSCHNSCKLIDRKKVFSFIWIRYQVELKLLYLGGMHQQELKKRPAEICLFPCMDEVYCTSTCTSTSTRRKS